VSDIFREVDEEVRREQLKKLWDRYGNLIIALAVLIVAGVAGFRGYQWYQAKLAAESGQAFTAAMVLSEQGKHEEAEAAFAKVAKDGTASYRTLAEFRAAAELAQRDAKAAVVAYDVLADNRSLNQTLRDLASLRAGYVLVDSAPYDEVRRRIEPLTGAERPFRHSARGLLALAAWRADDFAATKRWYEMILADGETPPSTRSQTEMLMSLMAGEGKS